MESFPNKLDINISIFQFFLTFFFLPRRVAPIPIQLRSTNLPIFLQPLALRFLFEFLPVVHLRSLCFCLIIPSKVGWFLSKERPSETYLLYTC